VVVVVVVRAEHVDDLAAAVEPQCGHTRCGRRGWWHCGQLLTDGAVILCCARRLLVRECDCFCFGTAMGGPEG
jgi:hypothetical protein